MPIPEEHLQRLEDDLPRRSVGLARCGGTSRVCRMKYRLTKRFLRSAEIETFFEYWRNSTTSPSCLRRPPMTR